MSVVKIFKPIRVEIRCGFQFYALQVGVFRKGWKLRRLHFRMLTQRGAGCRRNLAKFGEVDLSGVADTDDILSGLYSYR